MNTNELHDEDIDYEEIRDLVEDAQEHMQAAIGSLRSYVTLTNDGNTRERILEQLVILTHNDLGDLLENIMEELEGLEWERNAKQQERI